MAIRRRVSVRVPELRRTRSAVKSGGACRHRVLHGVGASVFGQINTDTECVAHHDEKSAVLARCTAALNAHGGDRADADPLGLITKQLTARAHTSVNRAWGVWAWGV